MAGYTSGATGSGCRVGSWPQRSREYYAGPPGRCRAAIHRQARPLLGQLDVSLDARQRIDRCSLAEKQHILLAGALSHHCRFLILDEPAAPLDQQENERLFTVVRRLQNNSIGVVFISHRIHELRAICDQLTVLRDDRLIETGPMAALSSEQIVEKMLRHQLENIYASRRRPFSDETLLKVEGLHDDSLLHNISLTLRKGEIPGIALLVGAGKTGLCKALFGASRSRINGGELHGQPWRPASPSAAVENRMAPVKTRFWRSRSSLSGPFRGPARSSGEPPLGLARFFSARPYWPALF